MSRSYAAKAVTETSSSDHQQDVLIVGGGAGALVAALRAEANGLRAIVTEKTSKIGGARGYSGCGVWIPNKAVSQAAGVQDSDEEALQYLKSAIGNLPSSTRNRKLAFLQHGVVLATGWISMSLNLTLTHF